MDTSTVRTIAHGSSAFRNRGILMTALRNGSLALLLISLSLYAKSAQEYFGQAAFLYAQAKYPTAEIEAREGLAKYPVDQKLQRLLKRIQEMQQKQKDQNDKENPGQQDDQGQSSSSQSQNQNQSQDQNGSSGTASSSSQQSQPQGLSSQNTSSSAGTQGEPPPQEGQLSKEEAEQLLKDYQESDKDRKKAIRTSGRAVPDKDW